LIHFKHELHESQLTISDYRWKWWHWEGHWFKLQRSRSTDDNRKKSCERGSTWTN